VEPGKRSSLVSVFPASAAKTGIVSVGEERDGSCGGVTSCVLAECSDPTTRLALVLGVLSGAWGFVGSVIHIEFVLVQHFWTNNCHMLMRGGRLAHEASGQM
jgi:hypothetical protein